MEGVKLVDVKHLPRALKFPLVYLIRNLLAKKTDFPGTETKEQTTVKLSQIFFNYLCQFCCHIFAKQKLQVCKHKVYSSCIKAIQFFLISVLFKVCNFCNVNIHTSYSFKQIPIFLEHLSRPLWKWTFEIVFDEINECLNSWKQVTIDKKYCRSGQEVWVYEY